MIRKTESPAPSPPVSTTAESAPPVSHPESTAAFIEDLHTRAETVTPLLRQILEYRPPPHWGNEVH
ncbi:MAG TPA: hypothetical protein VFV81_06770 [Verrucomicrobiae bacterium]|nr:hypothetical protein [Verrucomicrobiae bacterium]